MKTPATSARYVSFALVAASLSLGLVGCGIFQMPTKMDHTNRGMDNMSGKMDQTNGGLTDMSGKMDQTNGGLGQMNGKMDQTNAAITHTNDQIVQTNAAIAQTNDNMLAMLAEIKKTNGSMTDLVDKMTETSSAIHTQILLLAKDDLMKPDNTLVLYPPTAMMPAGEKFAEEATADESLELTQSWISDVDQASVDEDSLTADGYTTVEITRMKADLKHRKDAELTALQIVGGFLPQATVEAIVKHVSENGRYRKAGIVLLTFRTAFVQQVLLEDGVLKEGLHTYGNMLKAIEYVGDLDYLGRVSFTKEMAYSRDGTELLRFTPKPTLVDLLGKITTRFDSELDPIYKAPSADAVVTQQSTDLATLKTGVAKSLDYWNAQP